MIAVVVGEPSPGQVVHERALLWLGPACNLSADPAVRLIPGIEIAAERVTCWRCCHPAESAEMGPNGERRPGGAR